MVSDLCRDEFLFAWRQPVPQFTSDPDLVRDVLQQATNHMASIDIRSYSHDTLSAAVAGVIQTTGYSYGQCMKVLRMALCGPKVCTVVGFQYDCYTLQWETTVSW